MNSDETNEAILTSILETLGCTIKNVSRGFVHASCPLAPWRHGGGVDKNPSFGVVYSAAEAKREVGHGHCFSCGYSGDIREIASLIHVWGSITRPQLGSIMQLMEKVDSGNLPLSLYSSTADDPFPDAEWFESFQQVSRAHSDAVNYLTQRQAQPEAIKHFKVGYDPSRYRITFPLFDRAQRFRGMIGRTLIKEPMGPRYFYYPYKGNAPRGFTWFNENSLDLSKPVVVVEGVFDAMQVWPVYPNVVAALSVSFRKPGMGWHTQVNRWVTMFDTGQGGMSARARLTSHLMAPGSQVWHLDPPPGRSDPGEAHPSEIKTALDKLKVGKPLTGV